VTGFEKCWGIWLETLGYLARKVGVFGSKNLGIWLENLGYLARKVGVFGSKSWGIWLENSLRLFSNQTFS